MWAAAEPGRSQRGGHRMPAGLRLLVLVLPAIWLAACATPRAPQSLLPPEAQQALLRDLPQFEAEGRVSVTAGERREIANLDWTQQGPQARIRMAGPFGAGAITVDWSPQHLRLTSGGEVHQDAGAEALLVQQLGLSPPFDALRYWMLALEAPGEAPSLQRTSPDGRLEEITQRGWNIRYDRWVPVAAEAGGVMLPGRITIRRDALTLRVLVERWKL